MAHKTKKYSFQRNKKKTLAWVIGIVAVIAAIVIGVLVYNSTLSGDILLAGTINQTSGTGTISISGGYYDAAPKASFAAEGKAVYGLVEPKVVDGKSYG